MTTELRRRLQQLVLRDVQVTCEGSPEAVDRAVAKLAKHDVTYHDRLDGLTVELDALPDSVDPARVCDVLESAKREAFAAAAIIDGTRWGAEYFGTRAHRLADGERALRELLNLLPCEDDGDGQPSTTRARTLASDLLREVSAIRARPEWTITPAWPTTPQGRPTKPWNARARKALGVLGVPAEARDAILQAAGLILTPTVAENI